MPLIPIDTAAVTIYDFGQFTERIDAALNVRSCSGQFSWKTGKKVVERQDSGMGICASCRKLNVQAARFYCMLLDDATRWTRSRSAGPANPENMLPRRISVSQGFRVHHPWVFD
jgi:hypothetical protein